MRLRRGYKRITIILLSHLIVLTAFSQIDVPDIHAAIRSKKSGRIYFRHEGKKIREANSWIQKYAFGTDKYTLSNLTGNPTATATGVQLDFNSNKIKGELIYGLVPYGDSDHPMPVYRKRKKIKKGKVHIEIKNSFSGIYDMVGWQKSGHGIMGYRVINETGQILYDGRVAFKGTGPFTIDECIIEGPLLADLKEDGVSIFFNTNRAAKCTLEVDGETYADDAAVSYDEFKVSGLKPDQEYKYTVVCGLSSQEYSFRTAPAPGSRTAFVFGYTSDSRQGNGGGEREMYGVNAYIMKKIMALCTREEASFVQFTGDLINGYLPDTGRTNLQYANWKRSIEPYAHYLPVYAGMGNHEALIVPFVKLTTRDVWTVDRFPFNSHSAEAVFKYHFVNPENGPVSEDGAWYDPDTEKQDFPSYSENVYYYVHDNVAVIVLNSDYWYSPSIAYSPETDGNLHGYIMDKQLEWLEEIILQLESDKNIDHIFVTQHTPVFPNGGHSVDDMWYSGHNEPRPYIAGQPARKGIIERRDEYLDILVNKSSKVAAILTGDEHNYNRLHISEQMIRYPDAYAHEKLKLSRDILQINNGAAGAPYYAQEKLPWSEHVSGFTTQHAVVFIKVEGTRLEMVVVNPDTLEKIDEAVIRE